MNKIYMVEHYVQSGVDEDGTIIEDATIVGYFTNMKYVEEAKQQCFEKGIPEENIRVTEYPLRFSSSQRMMHVLIYEYYYMDDGRQEYYYVFPPLATEAECVQLRQKLMRSPTFDWAPNKYYYESSTGFRIQRFVLNKIQPFQSLL